MANRLGCVWSTKAEGGEVLRGQIECRACKGRLSYRVSGPIGVQQFLRRAITYSLKHHEGLPVPDESEA